MPCLDLTVPLFQMSHALSDLTVPLFQLSHALSDLTVLSFQMSHALSDLTIPLFQMSHASATALCRAQKLQCELYPSRVVSLCLDPYNSLGFVLWCLSR